ncbi:MAG: hypothetical protein LUD74_08015 [Tannerellaceae bacterium]|nr:hypothetical protein [Tannerellaceae bacterium]
MAKESPSTNQNKLLKNNKLFNNYQHEKNILLVLSLLLSLAATAQKFENLALTPPNGMEQLE